MTRYEIMRIWRSVSPESIITEDGLRICEAIRDNALEEAARACEDRSEREAYGHAKAACALDAEAIRALKSTAKGAGGL